MFGVKIVTNKQEKMICNTFGISKPKPFQKKPLLAHPYLPKLRQSVEYASGCETCAFGETVARLLAFALPLSLALSLLPARCCLKKLR